MQLNDDWVRKNISMVTPGTAKFLLERVVNQRLSLSLDVIRMLEDRIRGDAAPYPARPPDWAERAAGEKDSDGR